MFFGDLKPKKGTAHINIEWCKGCGICVQFCPQNVLVLSQGFNAKGYHPPEVEVADECRECHYCEIVCPDFAIYITIDDDEGDEEQEKPIA